jgi:indole-3-glycerol phosphate synthase
VSDFLAEACAAAGERVEQARAAVPPADLRARALAVPAPVSLASALAGSRVAVIAEVKRASPSRGPIADIPDPAGLAGAYARGGAAAVSVLTEPRWFSGSLDDLRAVRASVDVPVLRKDFVVDAYQVWEAREAGAAAVLLIVAALSPQQLKELLAVTAEAGLEAVIEVHDADEARGAADAAASAGVERPVIGVNARDLVSLQLDPDRFAEVRESLPDAAVAVAESGVTGPDDVRRLAGLGADAVLVGEHVARADDPSAAVAELVEAGRR